MSGFKLLAIRPLSGCHKEISKILIKGQIYSFYNEYSFLTSDEKKVDNEKEVEEITLNSLVPKKLYSVNQLEINISAIVGKNGVGKSTLLDVFYYSMYYLGTGLGIMNPYYSKLQNTLNNIEKSEAENIVRIKKEISKEKKKHKSLLGKVKVSIFYELENKIQELRVGDGNIVLITYKPNKDGTSYVKAKKPDIVSISSPEKDKKEIKKLLNRFFYSVSINYSHYSLNSEKIGNWINPLFHKNDAYLTPLVINPMREKGNFNINDEMEFATYRLLSNLLVEQSENVKNERIYITEKQFVKKVRFTYNPDKIKKNNRLRSDKKGITGEIESASLVQDLIGVFFDGLSVVDLTKSDLPYKDDIYNYLSQKVEKITETYDIYGEGYKFGDGTALNNSTFLERLKSDGSHIVYKIKQAINFLKNNSKSNSDFTLNTKQVYDFSLEDLLNWMNPNDPNDIINHLPPAIFKIDFILGYDSKKSGSKGASKFEDLSSGEQQLIHSIQSVLYHLNNINSAHASGDDRQVYNAVNIIYDEIELYYHPDYQRRFISELLRSLEKLEMSKTKNGVKSLNILFSTHSPFILSDIPQKNILKLEIDEKSGKSFPSDNNTETLGANIHDLLATSFFLNKSYMGEFIRDKISSLIDYLDNVNTHGWAKDDAVKFIDLVGDPMLKTDLKELFRSNPNLYSNEDIEKEMDRLKRLKNIRSN